MQRYIYLLTMLLITASLSACGGGGGDDGSDNGNDTQSTSPTDDDSNSDSGGSQSDGGSGSSQNYTLNALSGVNGKDGRAGRGDGVNVTLLNGGVDTSHQELADTKITGMYDVTSGDNAAAANDVTGIGTYIAGLTLGKNIGVAPAANLNIVRVFRDPANGIDPNASADALNYTINNLDTDVLLITYDVSDITTSDFSFALEDNAASKDWIVAITGGNVPEGASRRGVYGFASSADDPEYAGHMIVVGATDGKGELLPNSPAAYTPNSYGGDNLSGHFIVAPGVAICSSGVDGGTDATPSACDNAGKGNTPTSRTSYFNGYGTAPATALVAGAAASVRSAYPKLSGDQVVDVLLCSADDLGDAGYDDKFGAGRLNVTAAIALGKKIAAGGDFSDCDVPAETPKVDNSGSGGNDSTNLPGASQVAVIGDGPSQLTTDQGCQSVSRGVTSMLFFRDQRGEYHLSSNECLAPVNS